jgi:hypothetical protein
MYSIDTSRIKRADFVRRAMSAILFRRDFGGMRVRALMMFVIGATSSFVGQTRRRSISKGENLGSRFRQSCLLCNRSEHIRVESVIPLSILRFGVESKNMIQGLQVFHERKGRTFRILDSVL